MVPDHVWNAMESLPEWNGRRNDVAGLSSWWAKRARTAEELLADVANAGVAFDDPRIGYVEVQIDRPTWTALAAYRGR